MTDDRLAASPDDGAARYELAAPDVVSDLLGEEAVIINLDTGMYFRVTGVSAQVWAAIIDGADPASVPDDRGAEWTSFLGVLLDQGLIRPRLEGGEGAVLPTWTAGQLAIETHDDLQDLLALDPVHDVDTAAGWPQQPTT